MTTEQIASSDDRFQVEGYGGIAWYCAGVETAPDEDTIWTGIEEPTGRVCMVMVGDDRVFSIDPEDVTPIADEDYCHVCGQIGCTGDGR